MKKTRNKTICVKVLNKLLFLFIASTFFLIGCESTTNPPPIVELNKAVIVVNEGGYGQNNSSISTYSLEDKIVQTDVYYNANSKKNLGASANDIVISGEKGFIAVTVSNKIHIVEMRDFTSVDSIDFTTFGSPVKLVTSGTNGYVTTLNSLLVKFDISSYSVLDTISVGFKPEGIAISDGKIFIANSGYGVGTTVTVVEESTFRIVKNINVKLNPTNVVSDGNDVFVVSTGSYSDGIGMLTKIDATSLNIIDTLIISKNPGRLALGDDKELYVINGNGIVHVAGATMSIINETLVPASDVNNIYFSINAVGYDRDADLLYLGNPKDYQQNGEIAIYNSSGNEEGRFDAGISPRAIVFKK
ncbi:MAG: hypothetical protein L3J41_06700 [Melioribacteraceae bacterium]|nr:hypothetical protein [Melioribacteraceae bacterium]